MAGYIMELRKLLGTRPLILACVVFTSTDFMGEIHIDEDETETVAWFDPLKLPENINPPDRPVLEKFKKFKGEVTAGC